MPASLRFDGADKDMTLDELSEFVEAARRAKVPKHNPVRAVLSTSGKIKGVEILLEPDDD
jgi:hypothetical protein